MTLLLCFRMELTVLAVFEDIQSHGFEARVPNAKLIR